MRKSLLKDLAPAAALREHRLFERRLLRYRVQVLRVLEVVWRLGRLCLN